MKCWGFSGLVGHFPYLGIFVLIILGAFGFPFPFALIYIWRKSIVAPAVMHFLQDFVGIVLVPLFWMR